MILLASLTSSRVSVYQDNLSVWADARTHAPLKPRPSLNYAAALISAGELESGAAVLAHTDDLSLTRAGWERDHTIDIVTANRAVIELRKGNQEAAAILLAAADSNPIHAAQETVCQLFELCRHPPHSK